MVLHFNVQITDPPGGDDDVEEVDAEELARWIQEHRPHHTVSVRRVDA